MNNFLFLQSYELPATKDIFFAWIPSVSTKVDLFLDFTWIEDKTIILIHESVSELFPVDLNIYGNT